MKRSKFKVKQIIGAVKHHETSAQTQGICRKHNISDRMFYKWQWKLDDIEYHVSNYYVRSKKGNSG